MTFGQSLTGQVELYTVNGMKLYLAVKFSLFLTAKYAKNCRVRKKRFQHTHRLSHFNHDKAGGDTE